MFGEDLGASKTKQHKRASGLGGQRRGRATKQQQRAGSRTTEALAEEDRGAVEFLVVAARDGETREAAATRGGRRSDGEVVEALVAEVDGEGLARRGRTRGAPTSGAEAEARGGGAWARDGGRCQRQGGRLEELLSSGARRQGSHSSPLSGWRGKGEDERTRVRGSGG